MTIEALFTTKKMELIDKKEFAVIVLDENVKTFMVHVVILLVASTM